ESSRHTGYLRRPEPAAVSVFASPGDRAPSLWECEGADRLSRVADRRSPHDLEPLREPPPGRLLFTDEHRPARGREAGDATGQRRVRCRRPGRFPATLLERFPDRDEELRGHDG